MKQEEVLKFIKDNDIECRWQDFYENRQTVRKLNIWIPADFLKEFCRILGYSAFDDGGVCDTKLCNDGYTFVENFDYVLECYGIDAHDILPD